MLDRVLRFFITLFLAIAGGALLDLASPVLTMYVGTEILKMEMGIVRITMGSLICILLGAVLGGLIGFLASRTSFAVSSGSPHGWSSSSARCRSTTSSLVPSVLPSDS